MGTFFIENEIRFRMQAAKPDFSYILGIENA